MSSSSSNTQLEYLEELDSEFYNDIKDAKTISRSLKRPKDREVASKLIARVEGLNSNSLGVKSNRNAFTKYLLKVLKRNRENQPPHYDHWFKQQITKAPEETSLWSADNRTYVATKTIPGFGLLVYLAVTYEPDLGWQKNGFLSYNFTNQ